MSQPQSPFSLNMKPQPTNPFARPIRAALPSLAAAPITNQITSPRKQYNPFLIAQNTESPEFKGIYGVNKPLEKAMFLGYHDNKPIFGGNRLFILY